MKFRQAFSSPVESYAVCEFLILNIETLYLLSPGIFETLWSLTFVIILLTFPSEILL